MPILYSIFPRVSLLLVCYSSLIAIVDDGSTTSLIIELLFILVLILLNGFFAGTEIAVVSSGRRELEEMEKKGRRGARIVRRWLERPDDFLATVQVGITLVGAMAAAIGGATAVEWLEPRIATVPALAPWAEPLALLIAVLPITYVSLVLGELVPKSLAFRYRERAAVLVAPFIDGLATVASPVVRALTGSTWFFLGLFGVKPSDDQPKVTREELRWLLKEGGASGVFNREEQQIIPRVLDFGALKARDVMIPRERIVAVEESTPREDLLRILSEEHYTRMPVYRGTLDHVRGILHIKDFIYLWTHSDLFHLADVLRPPTIVSASMPARDLLDLFQKQHLHMAVVTDDSGAVVGLATLEDLVERIVGDIQDEHDADDHKTRGIS